MRGGISGGYRDMDRRVWVLFFAEMVSATGFSIVMPFLSIYFYDELGIPMTVVGAVYLAMGFVVALGNIVGGELADRLGRKRVMYSALYLRSAVFVLISVAIALTGNFILVAALVVIGASFGSLVEPALNAMIADVVEPGKRVKAYSLVRVGVNVGWAIGPMMGGILASLFSYSLLFMVTAMTTFTFATVVLLLIGESRRSSTEVGRFRPSMTIDVLRGNPVFLVFCIGVGLLFIVTSQMGSTLPAFAKTVIGLEEYQIGLVYMINGAMIVLFQLPMAGIIDRYRPSLMLIASAVMYTIGYALVGWSDGLYMLMGIMVIITIGEILMSPTSMNFVAKVAPEDARGRYMGVFGLFSAGGWAMGPTFGGFIMDALVSTPILMWATIASMGLMALAMFTLLGIKMVRAEAAS